MDRIALVLGSILICLLSTPLAKANEHEEQKAVLITGATSG
jgi:hypothetical protein